MSDQIDLSKKRNRIVLALDIFLGTICFGECWPTEPMSSYFWRTKKASWIKRVDRWFGEDHCRLSYEHSMSHLRVANESANLPTYQRVNTDTDYDTAGFTYYLLFDGVDDSLVTGNINFSATDKMTVLTADHSAWDDVTRGITGLSNSVVGYDGTFWLTSYDWICSSSPIAYLRGNLRGAGVYGPDQRTLGVRRLVRSFRFDISKDLLANETLIRLNGVPTPLASTPLDPSAGSGNFGNWPLYIGRIGSQYPFSGRLYGLIVRGAQTDDAHLTHAEKYLAYKSGVSL